MEYFYLQEVSFEKGEAVITGQEARHIAKVLRHKPGDEIFGTNGRGDEFRMVIKGIKPDRVLVQVLERRNGQREPRHMLTLAPAVLKGDKLSFVVEAVTELGVSEIVPFFSSRVIGRMGERKLQRLRTVAISGMKTALRTFLPEVRPAVEFESLVRRFKDFDRVLVAYEEEHATSLTAVLDSKVKSLLLVIGPEGGFTEEEVTGMREAGAALFTLGPRRLRAETAAVAATALCLGLLGDLK
ncbi:MAG: 16S rRNA (uracil(1498)-N(3))-methyltransferase [candidate division WOR-3 bacterium]